MNNYKIKYIVTDAQTAPPLSIIVPGKNEEDAKVRFFCSGLFYNTNDARKVIIESIRKL